MICKHLDNDDKNIGFFIKILRRKLSRNSKATFIKGSGKWQRLKGIKFIFATKYKGLYGF